MVRNGDSVVPFYPDPGIVGGDLPLPVEELTEVVGAIGRCSAEIGSEPEPWDSLGEVDDHAVPSAYELGGGTA